MKLLAVNSTSRNEYIDITGDIQDMVDSTGWSNGVVQVFIPHTTAGVTINEGADPDVRRDIVRTLSTLVPHRGDYHHGEGNSDAHIKATLTGSSVLIPLENGRLQLGTWQAVYFCEYDGPRSRKVWIQCLGV